MWKNETKTEGLCGYAISTYSVYWTMDIPAYSLFQPSTAFFSIPIQIMLSNYPLPDI